MREWNWPEAWAATHGFIDRQAAAAPRVNQERACPRCGAVCRLRFGRATGGWFWAHPRLDGAGARVRCAGTRDVARRFASAAEAMGEVVA